MLRVALILMLLICLSAMGETDVKFALTNPQFGISQTTNATVIVQAENISKNGTVTLLPLQIRQITDTNGVTVFSNLYGSSISGFYHWTVSVYNSSQRVNGDMWVSATNLGLVNEGVIDIVNGAPSYPAGTWCWSAQAADLRYQLNGVVSSNTFYPLFSNPSNYVNNATLIIQSNALQQQIVSGSVTATTATNIANGQTNGLATTNFVLGQGYVTALVTNGFETTNHAGATFYPTSNPSLFVPNSTLLIASNSIVTNTTATYYPTSNPSLFITLTPLNLASNFLSTNSAAIYYPTSNPSGFVTILVTNNAGAIANNIYTNGGAQITNYINAQIIAPASSSTNSWQLNGNNLAVNSFFGSTNNQNLVFVVSNSPEAYFLTNGNVSIGIGNSFSLQQNSFIVGMSNTISKNGSGANQGNSILGGAFNKSSSIAYGLIGGGFFNKMDSFPFEYILGGASNYVHSTFALIGSGILNSNLGFQSFIANGFENNATTPNSLIGNGSENQITSVAGTGARNSIVNGQNNQIIKTSFVGGSFEENSILNGNNVSITTPGVANTSFNTILNGNNSIINTANGNFLIGDNITNSADNDYSLGRNISVSHINNFFYNNSANTVTSTAAGMVVFYETNGFGVGTNSPITGGGLAVNGSITLNGLPITSSFATTNGLATTNFVNSNAVLQNSQATNIVANQTFSIGGALTYIITTNTLGVTNCGYAPVNGTYNNFGGLVWTNIFDARWTLKLVPIASWGIYSNNILQYINATTSYIGTNYTAQGTAATPTPIVYQGDWRNPYGEIQNPAMPMTLTGTNDPTGIVLAPVGSLYVYFTNGTPKQILVSTNQFGGWY